MAARAGRLRAAIVPVTTSPEDAIDYALERVAFWSRLQVALRAKAPEPLKVLIKPDLGGLELDSPCATTPRLVETLIDLLHARGAMDVAVAAAPDAASAWAENRETPVAADLLGYRFETPGGAAYDVLDLSLDATARPFGEGSVLRGCGLSELWLEADVRIVFAKNKTCEVNGYALSLDSLIDVLPAHDKDYHYRAGAQAGEVAAELMRVCPVQLALVDAVVSAHGSGASRAPEAIETGVLIASPDPRLTDLVGAIKMGLDPYVSAVFTQAAERMGLPTRYEVEGDLTAYPGWRNVHPVLLASARHRSAWIDADRTVKPWLQRTDSALFPFRNMIDGKLNSILAPAAGRVDADPGALWALVALNELLSSVYQGLFAYQVSFDKDAIRRLKASINIDLEALANEDFEAVRKDAEGWLALLHDLKAGEDGLVCRRFNRAVLFRVERELPMEFEAVTAALDVARSIQLMNDYVGGVALPVARDEDGRVVRQVERNLYLPQPNYLTVLGGEVIDVTKLETLEYTPDSHRMWWKTIKSENHSAQFDDGMVVLERTKGGDATRVIIAGRQLFDLPPLAKALHLELQPELEARLTEQAYGIFSRRTFANFEAVIEGRDPRIGRNWVEATSPETTELRPVEVLARLAEQAKTGDGPLGWIAQLIERQSARPDLTAGQTIDEDGFVHFAPVKSKPIEARADRFAATWTELGQALQFDMRTAVPREAKRGQVEV